MAEIVLGVLVLGAGVFAASGFAKLRGRRAYRDYRAGLVIRWEDTVFLYRPAG